MFTPAAAISYKIIFWAQGSSMCHFQLLNQIDKKLEQEELHFEYLQLLARFLSKIELVGFLVEF